MQITIIRQADPRFVSIDDSVALLRSSSSGPEALTILRWLHTLSSPSHPATETVRRVASCGELAELAGITRSSMRDALRRLSAAGMIALQVGVAGDPYLVEVRVMAQLRLGRPGVLAKLPALTQRSIIDVLAGEITERI